MSEAPEKHRIRPIRSFVLRTGRMTLAQKRAYEEAWPRYGLTVSQGMQHPQTLFGRQAETVLEIGFGMGDSLIEMAISNPDQDFIGVEVHTPGVGHLLRKTEENGLNNIRVYADDAVTVLEQCVPDETLAKIQIFFPDPWHKKKHHKRRIIQPAFAQLMWRKLKKDGMVHLATDWQAYAEHMMEVMSDARGFDNIMGGGNFSPRPAFRPQTKFEARGQRLGHGVWDLLFRKSGLLHCSDKTYPAQRPAQ